MSLKKSNKSCSKDVVCKYKLTLQQFRTMSLFNETARQKKAAALLI